MNKRCVLAAAGVCDTNADDNNTIFTIKDTKLYVSVVIISNCSVIINGKNYNQPIAFW